MSEECIVCREPLEYLETGEIMECYVCHKKEMTRARCVKGHYVCDECHRRGVDGILGLCLRESSKDPVFLLEQMMKEEFCHMHGPEHHVMVGAALLTAYRNAGGEVDLYLALVEMINRGREVPGGVCGFWGACGAGISTGIFVSIISGSTPLTAEPFGLSNLMTSKALEEIGRLGGPRCCKRDSYLSVLAAVDFVKVHFGIEMERPEVVCSRAGQNQQCIGKKCPFGAAHQ